MLGISDLLVTRMGRNEGAKGSLCLMLSNAQRLESVTAGGGSSLGAHGG